MEKKAKYTVECPIKFTFTASALLDRNLLIEEARKQMRKAIRKGDVILLTNNLMVIDKERLYTKKQKQEEERFWNELFNRR